MNRAVPDRVPLWDQLTGEQKAPYLHDARTYLSQDVGSEEQPTMTPEEFEYAVQKAAEETYSVVREAKLALVQPVAAHERSVTEARGPGQRISL
jgi:hypothetical protein